MEIAKEKEKVAYLSHLDSVDQILHGRQNLIKQLESSIAKEEFSSINEILSNMKNKSSTFGDERKKVLNSLFKRIVETQVPNLVKFLFWSAQENKGLFNNFFLDDAIA